LIRYRPFQNWDPPALAEIWRSQPPLRGRMQPITPAMLEELVFAKPYFDREGLILAVEGARPIGFAHAAFAANEDQSGVCRKQGTVAMALVGGHADRRQIALELIEAAEHYLRQRGTSRIYAGGQFPFNGFYLGLYGSSEDPGLLASDAQAIDLFRTAGYRETNQRVLLNRSLAGFRPIVDRQQLLLRRKFNVNFCGETLPDNWWENCVWSHAEWLRFSLTLRDGGEPIVAATFWEILPLSKAWGVRTMGLVRLEDTPEARSEGLTLLLLGDCFRILQEQHIAQVEVQTAADDASLLQVFNQLGLTEHDRASLFCKTGC
jgi:hypothetical protein